MIFWSFWAPTLFILTDLFASMLSSSLDGMIGEALHPGEPQYYTRTATHVVQDLLRAFRNPFNQFMLWTATFFFALQETAWYVGPNLRAWSEAQRM